MPRHRRIFHLHNILADEIADHGRLYIRSYPQTRDIPHRYVRGLVRGLLAYFSRPARRRGAEQIHLDTLEWWLLAWIEDETSHNATGRKRHKSTYTNEQVNRIAYQVPEVVTALLQHPSPLILEHESKWLMQKLAGYATLPKDSETRLQWIQRQLHRVLTGLQLIRRCPRINCERRTTVPGLVDLEVWSHCPVGELHLRILAHYHGSTYSTVKRLLRSRSSR